MVANLNMPETLTINQCVEEEIKLNVVRLNGDNNKKELDKSFVGKWQYKYNSTARNLVRMWWLTKFLTALLDNLINQAQMTLVQCCQDAY